MQLLEILIGLYASHQKYVLIINGQHTTLQYDSLSKLPLLFTKAGIHTFLSFQNSLMATSVISTDQHHSPDNLMKQQYHKRYLHKLCAHKGYSNLNRWIQMGLFPGTDPKLVAVPDSICPSCAFGKAHRVCHKMHTGHIAKNHTNPGDGVSSDGFESRTPGHPFTTKGSSTKLC